MAEEGDERKLTTVPAADVVGYNRLMAADEVGILTSLKAFLRELINSKTAEYWRRLVKLTGDRRLMEFASVADAVNIAVEVQRVMTERNVGLAEDRRVTYRIHTNIGSRYHHRGRRHLRIIASTEVEAYPQGASRYMHSYLVHP